MTYLNNVERQAVVQLEKPQWFHCTRKDGSGSIAARKGAGKSQKVVVVSKENGTLYTYIRTAKALRQWLDIFMGNGNPVRIDETSSQKLNAHLLTLGVTI